MTKISFRLLFAALAAIAVVAGCTKEISTEKAIINPASSQAEGSRIITVSFGPQTKTTLDGFQPRFADGDSILISNGNALDTCEVKDETISTNLTGPLKAVYPYKAAKMNDSNPKQIDTVLVSAVQSGTFADANICMAKDITNEAVFENKTAVLRFYVGSEIEVTSVTLESLSECFAPGIQKITVEASGGKTLYEQMSDNQDKRVCYVAIPKGTFSQLTITTTAKTQNPKPKQLTNVTFENNKIYSVFIPYYIQVGDQKWAYCNIGAFLPEEPGKYFAWGSIEGFKYHYEPEWQFDNAYEFSWENCPYIVSYKDDNDEANTFRKYVIHQKFWGDTGSMDNKQTLEPEDDAAHVAWQDQWRMPKKAELEQLAKLQASSIYGKYISVVDKLILPVTGHGLMKALTQYNCDGVYWSSDLSESEHLGSHAYSLSFHIDVYTQEITEEVSPTQRYKGYPIRPIYAGPAPAPEKPTSLSGEFTVGENKKVRFSRGNLYWDGTSSPGAYKFETEQYFYRHYPGKTDDVAFLGGGDFETTPVGTVGGFWWTKKGETAFYPYSESYNSSISISTSDCLFTNGAQEQANSDFTVNGETGVWRTLSGGPDGEWNYLLEKRTDAAIKVGCATVNGVTGVIILPDAFVDPGGNGVFVPINTADPKFTDNVYNFASWEEMESAGAVFLPAAGNSGTNRVVQDNQKLVYYWSSSAENNVGSVYSIWIGLKDENDPYNRTWDIENCGLWRYTAPVRLVTDAPVAGSTVEDLTVKDEDTDNWQ